MVSVTAAHIPQQDTYISKDSTK